MTKRKWITNARRPNEITIVTDMRKAGDIAEVGEPQKTGNITVNELKQLNYVGIYKVIK